MSRPRKYQQAAELKRQSPDALDEVPEDDDEQCEWFDDEPSEGDQRP